MLEQKNLARTGRRVSMFVIFFSTLTLYNLTIFSSLKKNSFYFLCFRWHLIIN